MQDQQDKTTISLEEAFELSSKEALIGPDTPMEALKTGIGEATKEIQSNNALTMLRPVSRNYQNLMIPHIVSTS
jgi:hypothetical protein